MFGVLVVTHAGLGAELVKIATHIMGNKLSNIKAISIPYMDEEFRKTFPEASFSFENRSHIVEANILAGIEEIDQGKGIIIFTDIIGGTAFNVAKRFTRNRDAILISGVNLPMLLKLPSIQGLEPEQAADELVNRSKGAITYQIFRKSKKNADH